MIQYCLVEYPVFWLYHKSGSWCLHQVIKCSWCYFILISRIKCSLFQIGPFSGVCPCFYLWAVTNWLGQEGVKTQSLRQAGTIGKFDSVHSRSGKCGTITIHRHLHKNDRLTLVIQKYCTESNKSQARQGRPKPFQNNWGHTHSHLLKKKTNRVHSSAEFCLKM